jgi:hypothetical protein
MRILGSVVAPSTTLMSSCDSKITGSGSIRPQIVRDQLVWDKSILLQQLAHEVQRGTLVPPALDQHIKHFALGIHGAPEVDQATIDLEIDLIEMPGSVGRLNVTDGKPDGDVTISDDGAATLPPPHMASAE